MLRKRYSIEKTDGFNLINSTELVSKKVIRGRAKSITTWKDCGIIVISSIAMTFLVFRKHIQGIERQ